MERRHYIALDGLRGIAALVVVMYHRRWWGPDGHFLDQGYLAVNFFFILSGFVIDHAYANRLKAQLSFGRFAVTRMIRLYPMIVIGVALGVSLPLLKALYHYDMQQAGMLVLTTAIAGLCLPLPARLAAEPFVLNRPLWSLFFELIANALYALLLFRLSLKMLIVLAVIGAVASIAMADRFGTILVGYQSGQLLGGLICVFPPFIIGMILNRVKDTWRLPPIPFWGAALLLILSFAPFSLGSFKPAYELAMVFGFYPLLILSVQQTEPTRRWASVAKASAYLSYPIYVLHYPVLEWLDTVRILEAMPHGIRLLAATLTCVIVAFAGARLETPMRRALTAKWHQRFASGRSAIKPASATASKR